MFSKLLKYEFRFQRGTLGLISVIALGAGVLGSLLMYIFSQALLRLEELPMSAISENMEVAYVILMMFSFLGAIVLLLAVFVYYSAVMIMQLYRFYQRLFTDQGYLTFTLPVTTHQILLSSILSMIIWSIIAAVITVISVSLILLPMFSMVARLSDMPVDTMIWDEMSYAFSILRENGSGTTIVLQIISSIASYLSGIILPLVALALGAMVAKKHKLLAGIGIYFGINMVVSVISGVVDIIAWVGDYAIVESMENGVMVLTILLPSLLYLALAVGGYFLTHYLVDKKLNLT